MKNNDKRMKLSLALSCVFIVFLMGLCMVRSNVSAKETYPYYIKVNKTQNTVTIYEKDEKGAYTVPVKAMTCSVGNATPLGVYKTPANYRWKLLQDNVWGQYSTRIVGSILFHSVWYYKMDPSTLSWVQYNKLGTTASKGCIRLTVEDAKWIYDKCPLGTTVEIYEGKDPGPLGKPETIKLKSGTGWDPTDPSKDNPFKDKTPSIKGAKDKTVTWGEKIDLLKGITATSTTGLDITSKIIVSGEVDVYTTGQYEVTYTVTDAIFRTTEQTIVITVKESSATPHFEGVSDKGIQVNTKVDKEYALKNVKAFHGNKELAKENIKVKIVEEANNSYVVTYTIEAPNGLIASKTTRFVVDTEAPILSGVFHREISKKELNLSQKELKALALEGVTVTDDLSKLTKNDIKVTVKNKSDYAYVVTYEVSDTAGNVTKEIVEFTYFSDIKIEGVSNYYNLPYGADIDKTYVKQGIRAIDKDGNDRTDEMVVKLSSYANDVYKITYQIENDDGNTISVVCYFTVSQIPDEEESGEFYEDTDEYWSDGDNE